MAQADLKVRAAYYVKKRLSSHLYMDAAKDGSGVSRAKSTQST
jgi:hypothetical protein